MKLKTKFMVCNHACRYCFWNMDAQGTSFCRISWTRMPQSMHQSGDAGGIETFAKWSRKWAVWHSKLFFHGILVRNMFAYFITFAMKQWIKELIPACSVTYILQIAHFTLWRPRNPSNQKRQRLAMKDE